MIARSIVEGSDPKALKIFYSYARDNSSVREALDSTLAEFKWDVLVEPWHDGNIAPGDPWAEEIHRNLSSADIILLFVTDAFMKSEYCNKIEVPLALQRHYTGQARVIPIILEETDPDWRTAPFSKLQALPQNGSPVSRWQDPEEALRHITQAIINLIVQQGIRHRPKTKWKLVLEGDVQDFTYNKELAIVQILRNYSGDESLRPIEVTRGSISILIESTGDALQKVLVGTQSKDLSLPGWNILLIVELYGAGVQTYAETCDGKRRQGPLERPHPDALLYPSEDATATVMTYLAVDASAKAQFQMSFDDGTGPIPRARMQPDIHARLMDFFFTGLAIRNDECWVNLGPDEKNRMLPDYLGGTHLGRVMIEQDYQLKRLCASLLHPDCKHGRSFWDSVYDRAQMLLGTTSLPYYTFFRVWVVPDHLSILEGPSDEEYAKGKGFAEIGDARLKVLSEREYLPAYAGSQRDLPSAMSDICYAAFEKTILPVVNREVREGANWVPLREVYNSLILAQWFKSRFGGHPFGEQFIETHKPPKINVPGADVTFSCHKASENMEYHRKYMDIFEKGVFYAERDDYDRHCHKKIMRVYFAGAIDFREILNRAMAASTAHLTSRTPILFGARFPRSTGEGLWHQTLRN